MLPHTPLCMPVSSQMKTVLPFTVLHSVFHTAGETQRSRRLGLAHQECNGAAGEILHLSYSWGTTSVRLLHGDQLLAPNAINPTNLVCGGVWACVCVVCIRASKPIRRHLSNTIHKDGLANIAISQIIISPIWFGFRLFWLQFGLLKQSFSPFQSFWVGRCSLTEGQSRGRWRWMMKIMLICNQFYERLKLRQ